MANITENIREIVNQIRMLEAKYERSPGSVTLLAVSKQQPAQSIREAYQAGIRDFGENYVQEAEGKIQQFDQKDLRWHFIGPIQSNKTRQIATLFHWVHSIDRLKIAQRLSDQRDPALGQLNCCVQVNISGERSKSGVPVAQTADLCSAISSLPRLRLRGLMAIPAPFASFAEQRAEFARLRVLFETLKPQFTDFDCLSMGMSADFEAAIAEGSTLVRIGTAVFGSRI
ncbi:MAG: YggS family pyridoxal phosphate-dependent enzyme [Pseudohongiellaceae bacterium]